VDALSVEPVIRRLAMLRRDRANVPSPPNPKKSPVTGPSLRQNAIWSNSITDTANKPEKNDRTAGCKAAEKFGRSGNACPAPSKRTR